MLKYPLKPNRHTLGDQVFSKIKEDIITVRLKPGQLVYENEIAESMGISRTPVREAIRMLLMEDLLEVLPARGIRIAHITVEKITGVQFVRESLEVSAFKQVAAQWNAADPVFRLQNERLSQLIGQQKQAAQNNDYLEFLRLDEQFHYQIMSQLNNKTLLDTVSQMRGHLNRMRFLGFSEVHGMEPFITDHTLILRCIESGDIPGMERYLVSHLRMLLDVIPEMMKKYPDYFSE